jgi:APA family basic amino acid/polyamine antiporter
MGKLKLKRELGLLEAIFYGIGIILGAGVYVLIGQAAGMAGNSLWLSFAIGALVASFTGLSYAELSAMYPKAAAEFVYVKKAYGSEFWAFIIGWLLIFTGVIAVATVSLGFSGYFFEILNLSKQFQSQVMILVSIALIIFLSFINFYGIKESSNLNILFTTIEVLGLVVVIVLGLSKIITATPLNYFEAPHGLEGILSATTLVFFAYLGFEDVVNISEETKTPKKLIPLALFLSIIITTLIYVLISLSVVNLASWNELAASAAPLALAASNVLGDNAFLFVSISALFATTSTSLILLIVTSRMLYGMAREGSFPKILAKVHPKKRTPYIAVIVAMLLSIVFVLMGNIERVARITSLSSLIAFSAVNLSLIYLRFMQPGMYRPFKTPLNIGKFPLTAFFGVISCMLLMAYFDLELILFCFVILLAGSIFYVVHKIKTSKQGSL